MRPPDSHRNNVVGIDGVFRGVVGKEGMAGIQVPNVWVAPGGTGEPLVRVGR